MAFVIKIRKSKHDTQDIASAIRRALAVSRFVADVRTAKNKISVHGVRLLEKKHYCGNHPLPCPVRPFPKRHVKSDCLEGADWVAFNDMLNDVLDSLEVDADAGSSLVTIRKGEERCTYYDAQRLPNGIDNEWRRNSGQFENRIGQKSERSGYPEGTPGIPEWTRDYNKDLYPLHDDH
jgi:hypothetical protein